MRRSLIAFAVPFLLLAVWEFVGQCGDQIAPFLVSLGYDATRVPDFSFLQPVSKIIPRLCVLVQTGEILPYFWDTTRRSGVAFLLAIGCGVSLGIILGLKRSAEALLLPTVDALRTLPPVALLPMLILFLGIDDPMKIAFAFFGGVWPVVISTAMAVKSVDPVYLKVAINSGHGPFCILRRVIMPAALPGIFTGAKISLSITVILSVVCEMLIGNSGLGFYLNYAKRNLAYEDMFACIIAIALLGWSANSLLHLADRLLLSWYYGSREAQMVDHHVGGN